MEPALPRGERDRVEGQPLRPGPDRDAVRPRGNGTEAGVLVQSIAIGIAADGSVADWADT